MSRIIGRVLIEASLQSIRTFYPTLQIVIINGSLPNNSCKQYVKSIRDPFVRSVSLDYNIGHGKGMHKGLEMAKTDYALLFDSDIIMQKPPIEEMMALFEDKTFGVGEIQFVNKDGINVSPHNTDAISYSHPYFQLINIHVYKNFIPYAHHGAPCILTMIDIHKKGLSGGLLKDFPVRDSVEHRWRGTRELRPKEFSMDWVSPEINLNKTLSKWQEKSCKCKNHRCNVN